MIKKDAFWRTLFNYVLIPVSLFVVVFFFYKKVYSRIVFLERDVKQLDFSDKYKTLEMKLETNNVYIDNIILQFDKRISKINKDITSLSDDVTSLKSSIVAEDKFNELRSSVVTLDCLEDKLNDVRAFINKSLEEKSKLYANLVEVKKEVAESLKKEEEERIKKEMEEAGKKKEEEKKLQKENEEEEDDAEDEFEDNEDDVEDGEDDIEDDEDEEDDVEDEEENEDDVEDEEDDYEDEEDDDEENEDVSSAPNPASDDTGENRCSENQECKDNKEDDNKKANVVAEGKSKTESDDENDSDVENNQYKDLDEGLEDYDDYNEDIFFNDTDNKKKDVITQPNEQIDNKSAIGDYNRDKEVENLIQSLEQAKKRVDDLEGIVSNYEKGYSLFKLQACFGPSFTWLMELIKKKNDRIKIPCSFFLNLPFSRILPMISYHCLFYIKRGDEERKDDLLKGGEIDKKGESNNIINDDIKEEEIKGEEDNIVKESNKAVGKNISNKEIINEKNAVKNINEGKSERGDIIKDKKKGRDPFAPCLETSPVMFCVSLLRIIKTSFFFLDFGFKIYYPENASDKTAKEIVKNFWDWFGKQIVTREPWCFFLGFNLGPQLLFFFSFSCSDWSSFIKDWDTQRARMEDEGKLECGKLFKKILDNFTIEIRFFEVSI